MQTRLQNLPDLAPLQPSQGRRNRPPNECWNSSAGPPPQKKGFDMFDGFLLLFDDVSKNVDDSNIFDENANMFHDISPFHRQQDGPLYHIHVILFVDTTKSGQSDGTV